VQLQEFGMFLALPILAVLKVIFDRVESLEPWGYLMGDHFKTYTWRNIKLPLFDSENAQRHRQLCHGRWFHKTPKITA
jgi:hypothetical protein